MTVADVGPLADVAAVRAGVGVQRTADRAGNAHELLQARQPFAHGGRDDVPQPGPAAGRNAAPANGDLAKRRGRQVNHQAPRSLVAHQHVRAAAQAAARPAPLRKPAAPGPTAPRPRSARRRTRPALPGGTRCAGPGARHRARYVQTRCTRTIAAAWLCRKHLSAAMIGPAAGSVNAREPVKWTAVIRRCKLAPGRFCDVALSRRAAQAVLLLAARLEQLSNYRPRPNLHSGAADNQAG